MTDSKMIRGMSSEEYHADPRPSWSTVKLAMLDCPLAAKVRSETQSEPTPAMQLGSLVHTLTLEPETFDRLYHVTEATRRGTKAWKADEDEAGDRTLIKSSEYLEAQALAELLRGAAADAGITIDPEWVELSCYSSRPGTPARARPDLLDPKTGLVWDVKTTRSLRPQAFMRQCLNLGYYGQIVNNAEILSDVLDTEIKPGGIIAVQTGFPRHAIALPFGEDALAVGGHQYAEAWRIWLDCEAADHWPAYEYPGGVLGVPSWMESESADDDE
jgi:hypothetical protein